MEISNESVEIFTKFPHGNKEREKRLSGIKKDIENNKVPPLYKEGLEFTKNINLKNKIIIDAGCGSGTKTIPLAFKTNAKKVIGIDGSKIAVENATYFKKKLKLKNIDFFNDRMENMKKILITNKLTGVDMIVNYQNLHHVSDWKGMLKIFHDTLKKNGILIVNIVDPTSGFSGFLLKNKFCYYLSKNPATRAKIGKFLFGFVENYKNKDEIKDLDFYVDRFGAFYHWIFPSQIIREMKKVGFDVCETFPHTRLDDWLVANKNSPRAKKIIKYKKFFYPSKYLFSTLMRIRQYILGKDTRTYYAVKKN